MVDIVKAWQDISLQLLHGFLMVRRCGLGREALDSTWARIEMVPWALVGARLLMVLGLHEMVSKDFWTPQWIDRNYSQSHSGPITDCLV